MSRFSNKRDLEKARQWVEGVFSMSGDNRQKFIIGLLDELIEDAPDGEWVIISTDDSSSAVVWSDGVKLWSNDNGTGLYGYVMDYDVIPVEVSIIK